MRTVSDGYWTWLSREEEPDYVITGKYLFFSEDRDKLFEIAKNEILNHHFHQAKINENLPEGLSEHVLCLYYKNDCRKYELAKRNELKYNVKFRYWKSEMAAGKGPGSENCSGKRPGFLMPDTGDGTQAR
jgi:hypothetical protein